jgi:hypothetical protein
MGKKQTIEPRIPGLRWGIVTLQKTKQRPILYEATAFFPAAFIARNQFNCFHNAN